MYRHPPQVRALLINEAIRIPVLAQYESRFSMRIQFPDPAHSETDGHLFHFVAPLNGREFNLGPCRIVPSDDEGACSLMFLDTQLDCRQFFIDRYAAESRKELAELRGLLSVPDRVHDEFKLYTADLVYHLNVYRSIFGDLDATVSDMPGDIKLKVQQDVIESEGPRFFSFLDLKLSELKQLVEAYGSEEHQAHGYYFRKHLWSFLICSPLIRRTNIKPRGFAGDSKVMRLIYGENTHLSSTFSKLLHSHAVGHAAAQSVRNRINMVSKMIRNLPNELPAARRNKIKIMSVGCGPSLEVQNIFRSSEDFDLYQMTLLDQDHMAISESADLIKRVEGKYRKRIETNYVNASIRTMIFSKKLKRDTGEEEYDFIYSLGLFDYLSFPIAKALLKSLYKMLKSGGYMLIGNFHVDNPSKYYMEYWCDWVLRHRTENEFEDLAHGLVGADTKIIFEETGSQMFLYIRKTNTVRKVHPRHSKATATEPRITSIPTE
jgi:extracellular factor (EF) 3-hydroxypalmitic acid methyl ester biosynthesis protein